MSRQQRPRRGLHLAERALRDLRGIEAYSREKWGAKVAARYVDDLEAALVRLAQRPELARSEPTFHPALQFYRVKQHLLVCDQVPTLTVVLAVIHASMDLPSRLAELQPQFAAEVEMLHEQLAQKTRDGGEAEN